MVVISGQNTTEGLVSFLRTVYQGEILRNTTEGLVMLFVYQGGILFKGSLTRGTIKPLQRPRSPSGDRLRL